MNPFATPPGTFAYAVLALIAFAANSVLARLALGDASIDPASYSSVRLISGALMLVLLTIPAGNRRPAASGDWLSSAMLCVYAAAFSFAYVGLEAGTGALILFGAVQVTMILTALWSGERPRPFEWLGLIIAAAGLVHLVSPGLEAPPPASSPLMAIAGIAWGVYSLRGRSVANALAHTAGNFLRSVVFVAPLSILMLQSAEISMPGMLLAIASGTLGSGVGYFIWYSALRGLTATRAATVQLAVPILAALGGVVFLSEPIGLRLAVSTVLVLGGIGMAVWGRASRRAAR